MIKQSAFEKCMLNYGTAYPAEWDLISKENFVIISNSKPLWKVQNMLDHVFITL